VVLVVHLIILFVFKKDTRHQITFSPPPPKHHLNKIDFISKEDLARIKHVGIEQGKKNLEQPDFVQNSKPIIFKPKPQTPSSSVTTPSAPSAPSSQQQNRPIVNSSPITHTEKYGQEKVIAPTSSHEIVKQDAVRNLSFNKSGIAAQKISNFEIRYERPEGVSEDELNSDEKAFYSFYKRSYASYVSKLYATYDEIAISRPKIHRDFENKHLLVGRIDYDKNGNIIMVKILKSSESDDVHYFFEETLKKLVLPNPPKIFLKMKKEFSIYYQVQIN
jgi:hypothetical protein